MYYARFIPSIEQIPDNLEILNFLFLYFLCLQSAKYEVQTLNFNFKNFTVSVTKEAFCRFSLRVCELFAVKINIWTGHTDRGIPQAYIYITHDHG